MDRTKASSGVPALSLGRRAAPVVVALVALNAGLWVAALVVFRQFPLLLGTATIAYTFGLRHAVDADHISVIDNVTRRMMHEGKRPLTVGLFFSLGHSTIVMLLSVAIALATAQLQTRFARFREVGGLIGTSASVFFLMLVAVLNLVVLFEVVRAFRRVKRGQPYDERTMEQSLQGLGVMGRFLRPALRLVDRPWKMYVVGFLFGLGFDTATEVGLLGISATTATQNLPIWSILLFPALFTAGMCLIDTADGILMLGAYGWAFRHPVRKLYYNMTITGVSVLVAFVVGGAEGLGLVADRMSFHGAFWNGLTTLNGHPGLVGMMIILICAGCWAVGGVRVWFPGVERACGADSAVVSRMGASQRDAARAGDAARTGASHADDGERAAEADGQPSQGEAAQRHTGTGARMR
jgi:high-affinity nickel-transport protein